MNHLRQIGEVSEVITKFCKDGGNWSKMDTDIFLQQKKLALLVADLKKDWKKYGTL